MKYNSFEEMKAAVSGEAVSEEIVEKRHTSWMDAIRKLKKDMKEMENNPLGKTKSDESEEELWNAQREETSISGGFDSFSQMKKLLFQEKKENFYCCKNQTTTGRNWMFGR